MKKLFAITLLFTLAQTSVAATSMPDSAKLLFQVKVCSSDLFLALTGNTALESARNDCRKEMEDWIAGHGDEKARVNLEYQCQSVFHVWGPVESVKRYYNDGNSHYFASTSVNLYCDPRSFQQKVAISAMQACEKEPKPECMSKEYMDAFVKIQKTNYYDIFPK